ncbi:MAG: hypothetical protein HYR76_10160 [Ignavibacteria bacterium]|nr:hypothetical protein [Ignavibacteria bacterium]
MKTQRPYQASLLFHIAAIFVFVLFFIANTGIHFANQPGLISEVSTTLYSTAFGNQPQGQITESSQPLSVDGLDPFPPPPPPPQPVK